MKIKNSFISILLMFLVSITSCVQSVDCENCIDDLRTIWSYKLRLPFGVDLAEDEIITQNGDASKIVVLDSKTGSVKDQLSTTYGEKGEGAVISWGLNKKFIVYEQVFDYKKSYIKIYNRLQHTTNDSISISLDKDLSASHGIVKIFGRPVIVDSTLLFVSNNGVLNSYNLLKKNISWSYNFNSLPKSNSAIITTKRYIHMQLPVFLGDGFEIVTLSKETGKLLWKKYFPGKLQLSKINDKLLSINKHGDLVYIDPISGHFDSHHFTNQKACFFQIINNKFIALATENNTFIVKDIADNKVHIKYKLCAEPIEVKYSKKMNALFLVDKAQHCIEIDLNNLNTKCIQQYVDNSYNRQNFIVKEDSLYINKGGKLRMLQLK